MTTPIALQLYTLREALKKDYRGTLEKISAMGYIGIELAGFPEEITPRQARQLFADLELTVTSAHSQLPLGEDKTKVIETMAAVECSHLVCPWVNPDFYRSVDSIKRLAETFNQAYDVCVEHNLNFSIHNHDFEYQRIGGIPAIQILKDTIAPGIGFEIDTYWVYVAGQDPAKVVMDFGERARLLHIKDGSGISGEPNQAVGDGAVDVPGIIAAGAENTAWLIVEFDTCATDMLAAVQKSYRYLTANGLARGKV